VSKTNFVDATDGAAPEPPWLSVPESEAWMPLAGLIRKLPAALDTQLRREAGISHFEYVVLSRLADSPQRTLRMSDLAEYADGSLSRLSHVVTRLEHRGWIRREPCPEDGRFTNAILTDDGYAKVVATAPGHVQTVRAMVIDALSPTQLRQLRDIGKRILHQIDPDAAWPPPRERATGREAKRGT
jgi:DNA-binding MarR family transcriptional regulator